MSNNDNITSLYKLIKNSKTFIGICCIHIYIFNDKFNRLSVINSWAEFDFNPCLYLTTLDLDAGNTRIFGFQIKILWPGCIPPSKLKSSVAYIYVYIFYIYTVYAYTPNRALKRC